MKAGSNNIVFLGAPGAGKGTQCKVVSERLNIPHISTGDLFRAEVKLGTPLGNKVKEILDRGGLVSDDIVIEMVKKKILELKEKEGGKGFLLDGFPRTVPQAKALDKMLSDLGMELGTVIFLDVDDKTLLERVAKRASESQEKRADDDIEVFKNRLDVYRRQTAPLVDYYRNQGKLAEINGDGSIEEVSSRILGAIESRNV